MTQALYFIIKTLAQLYLLLLLLRFWLPILRADFRNPIAQGILRITSPLIIPLRRIVPPIGRLDTSTIMVAYILEFLLVLVLLAIRGLTVRLKVILSWVAPQNYNPMTVLLNTMAEPVLRPFRRIIPPIGGFDISPIFAIILLKAAEIVLQTYRPIPI
jgi:YggT family protein